MTPIAIHVAPIHSAPSAPSRSASIHLGGGTADASDAKPGRFEQMVARAQAAESARGAKSDDASGASDGSADAPASSAADGAADGAANVLAQWLSGASGAAAAATADEGSGGVPATDKTAGKKSPRSSGTGRFIKAKPSAPAEGPSPVGLVALALGAAPAPVAAASTGAASQSEGPADAAAPSAGTARPSLPTPDPAGERSGTMRLWNVQELSHQIRVALGATQRPGTGAAATGAVPAASVAEAGDAANPAHAGLTALGFAPANGKGELNARLSASPDPARLDGAAARETVAAADSATADASLAAAESTAVDPRRTHDATDRSADLASLLAARHDWSPSPARNPDGTNAAPSFGDQMQQVADFLATHTSGVVRLGDKGVEANLKLYPPDLGGVRVTLNVGANHATQAMFTVDRPETAALLTQHLDQFRDSLTRHGLAVDRVTVALDARSIAASPDSRPAWNDYPQSGQGSPQDTPHGDPQRQRQGAAGEWTSAWDQAQQTNA